MMATKQRDLFEIIHTHGRAAFFVVGAVAVLFGHTFVVQIRHLKHIVVVQFLKMRHHGRLRCMKQFVAVNVQQPINAARAVLPRVVVAAAAAGGGGGGSGDLLVVVQGTLHRHFAIQMLPCLHFVGKKGMQRRVTVALLPLGC